MTEEEYRYTHVYNTGEFYYDMGKLLMNKNTRIDELVSFARSYGFALDIKFFPEPTTQAAEELYKAEELCKNDQ